MKSDPIPEYEVCWIINRAHQPCPWSCSSPFLARLPRRGPSGVQGGSGLFDAPAPSVAAPPAINGGGQAGVKRVGGASQSAQAEAEAEAVIKRALVVGNFEAAVQCCMSAGHMADAILLAR